MKGLLLPRCTPVSSEEFGEALLVRQHSHSPCQMPGRVKGREWQLACPWGLALVGSKAIVNHTRLRWVQGCWGESPAQ